MTGRRLANKLGLKFQTDISNLTSEDDVVIRYGNAQLPLNKSRDTECNSRDAIIKASAKHRLNHYLEGTDIFSPEYIPYKQNRDIPFGPGEKFLCRSSQHRAGKDITISMRGNPIPPETEYLVPLYEHITREYRVHVVFGKVVKVMRKYPINAMADPIIKTAFFGWQYRRSALEKVQCSKAMTNVALETAEILGLKFCGIDMAWSGKEEGLGKWIIWEVNSAPSLNSDSLNLYTNLFKANLPERLNEIRKPNQNNGGGKPSN